MSWIDWCIVVIPLTILLFVAFYSKKYVKSVVDFLAAGRVAGRYLLSVGDFMSTLSVITLIAGIEMYFQQITENIYGILEQTSLNDMETFLNNVLDYFLAIHKNNITAHNELESLQLTDPKVGALYQNIKEEVLTKVTRLFEDKLSNASHAKEKILISYQLMEDFCHFSISNSADEMDIDYMKKVIIRSVMDILKN